MFHCSFFQIVVDEEPHNQSRSSNKNTWQELMNLEPKQRFGDEEDESEEFDEHFHDDHNHLSDDGFFCGSGPG